MSGGLSGIRLFIYISIHDTYIASQIVYCNVYTRIARTCVLTVIFGLNIAFTVRKIRIKLMHISKNLFLHI